MKLLVSLKIIILKKCMINHQLKLVYTVEKVLFHMVNITNTKEIRRPVTFGG